MKSFISTVLVTVLFLSFSLTLRAGHADADQLYHWVDDHGVLHYTNQLAAVPEEKQYESFQTKKEVVIVDDTFDEEIDEGLEEEPAVNTAPPANTLPGKPFMTEGDAQSTRDQIRTLSANEKALQKIIEEKEEKLEKYKGDGYGPSDIAYLEQDIKTLQKQLEPLQETRAEMEAALASTGPR